MAKVTIRNSKSTIEIPNGSRLIEYAGEHFMIGCSEGKCGTCICTVLSGIENLNQKSHEEWSTLSRMNATPKQRLACQIWVKKGEVEIEI